MFNFTLNPQLDGFALATLDKTWISFQPLVAVHLY